jgi:hypothetical protein
VIAFSEPPNKSRLFLQDLRSTTQTGKVLKVSEFSAHYFFLKNLPNLAMIPSAVSSPLFTFSTAALNAKHCLGFESINRLRSAISSRLSYCFRSTSRLKGQIDPGQQVPAGASVVQVFEHQDRLELHFRQALWRRSLCPTSAMPWPCGMRPARWFTWGSRLPSSVGRCLEPFTHQPAKLTWSGFERRKRI